MIIDQFVSQNCIYNVTSLITFLREKALETDDTSILDYDLVPTHKGDDEIYQWQIVSPWLAEKLAAKDEVIIRDIHGIDCIWGRTVCGQQIACDSVIQEIYDELMAG